MATAAVGSIRDPKTLFAIFKYGIYTLLCVNVFLFFKEELFASAVTFSDGLSLAQLAEAFAATIDTAAWIVLLLIFELETSVLRDEKAEGVLKWTLHGVSALCYLLILYSFWGYVAKLYTLSTGFAPFPVADACSLVGGDASLALKLDEYAALDAANCAALAGGELYRLAEQPIYAAHGTVTAILGLAWVDVLNAAAWLGVVIVLEADVWMQQNDRLTDRFLRISKISKVVVYGTLFAASVYWGFLGDFVDFWDAVLWLVAFVFIEMNFFEWHAEEAEAEAEA